MMRVNIADTRDDIRKEFFQSEIEPIDAIERLERIGFTPREAEAIVDDWATATPKGRDERTG